MINQKTTPEQIRRIGLEALERELGVVGATQFLQQYDLGSGDYAVERHEWQDKLSVEDVVAQIKARRQEKAE